MKFDINGNKEDVSAMLVSAERYALGRRTYIVKWTCDFIKNNMELLTNKDKNVIIKDIKGAKYWGDDIDEKEWKELYSVLIGEKKKIYFISDTHFNHENIIKYCNRPYKNKNEMNEDIIKKWNEVVNKEDTVYHLGDFALGTKEEFKEIADRLNGKIVLIKGNHDYKTQIYEELGFLVLKNVPIKFEKEKLLLSHKPLADAEIPNGYINIHGHIHNNPLHKINPSTIEAEYPEHLYYEKLHINVSVDVIDFKPISLEEVLKKIKGK